MVTRRIFISAAAAVASLASCMPRVLASRSSAGLAPAPNRRPTPAPTSTPTKPSPLATKLAQALQRDLPQAHLSDAMTEKIASDIQDTLVIGASFRKRSNERLPAPDFVFAAANQDRP